MKTNQPNWQEFRLSPLRGFRSAALTRHWTIAATALLLQMPGFGQSGVAYRDYNGNGSRDGAAEPGVEGIQVKLFINGTTPAKDQLIGTAVTGVNGAYNFSSPVSGRAANAGEKVRIEFAIPLSASCDRVSNLYDFPSKSAGSYGSSVQFIVGPAATANFALNYAGEFVAGLSPDIYVPCYVNGDPLGGGESGTRDAFVKVPFTASGRPLMNGGTGPNPIHLASNSQVGTTYGVAFSRQAKKIFAGALMKRHCGFGPLGPGGIYMIDPDTAAVTNFLNLHDLNIFTCDTIGAYTSNVVSGTWNGSFYNPPLQVPFSPVIGTNAQRGLEIDSPNPQPDAQAYDQPGKLSLGDVDISDDGRFLYVVNLYDRKLYEIDLGNAKNPTAPTLINAAARVRSWVIPDAATNAAQGEHRPFGLAYYRGKVYCGVVLSAQNQDGTNAGTTADMMGIIYSINPRVAAPTFTTVTSFPMSYRAEAPWVPWNNRYYHYGSEKGEGPAQPMITDIVFYKNGEMVLGFTDRSGHQAGWNNDDPAGGHYPPYGDLGIIQGDVVRLNPIPQPDGSCTYSIVANGGGAEFYNDNLFHTESSMGALAMLPGGGDVVATFMDPQTTLSAGLTWYNNDTGARNRTYEVFWSNFIPSTFGKANGLGDLELYSDAAGIEIGNLVWNDTDGDGVQDADETGIPGVTVELFDSSGSTLLGTTNTNGSGNYYFTDANVTMNGASGLEPNTNYIICIGSSDFNASVGVGDLAGKLLTASNQSGLGLVDQSDSDAIITGGKACITLRTGSDGENNHSYDFGFKPIPATCYLVANATNIQRNDNGTPLASDDTFTFQVTVTGQLLGANFTSSPAPTPGNPGSYNAAVAFGPFPVSAGTANVTFTDSADPNCQTSVQIPPPLATCGLTAVATFFVYEDQNTSDPNDDTWSVDIRVGGTNLGAGGWTADNTPSSGSYLSPIRFGPFPYSAASVTIVFRDAEDPLCETEFTVNQPPPTPDCCPQIILGAP